MGFAFALALVLLIGVSVPAFGQAVPAAPATAESAPEYRLGPGDKLKIQVFGHADLTGEIEVDSSGRIAMPLIGSVRAAGLSLPELRQNITQALDRDYIVNPRVNVEVANYRPFFILGQVNKPGSYSYVNGMNVRQAVAIGGGFTRRAQEEAVKITRGSGPSGEGESGTLDSPVLPGDAIFVDRRLF